MTPAERAAREWTEKQVLPADHHDTLAIDAFLAGVEWMREQVEKQFGVLLPEWRKAEELDSE